MIEGDALEYSNPAELGAGSYGVAIAVTTPDARRIAVKLIPKRTNFASTSDGRIAFAARELDVMDKMKAADARHVMVYNRGVEHKNLFEDCRRIGGTAAKRHLQNLILELSQNRLHCKLVFCIEMDWAQGSVRSFSRALLSKRDDDTDSAKLRMPVVGGADAARVC